MTITLNHVKIEGTGKLLSDVGITVANDKFELASGSLDMNGKKVTGNANTQDVVFGADVTIANYAGGNQNFYTNGGTQITNAAELKGVTFSWDTSSSHWKADT